MNLQAVMTSDPACATPMTPLGEVAQMMVANDCGLIPVVDDMDSRHLTGVITDRDMVVRAVAHGRNPLDMCAGDIMTTPGVSVTADTSVDECCEIMETNQIRRVPVVDRDGRIDGIVALADLARVEDSDTVAEVVREVSESR